MSSFDFGLVNTTQREAVITTEGPVLMIAGPGTGKTFTLVKRIAYLVKEKNVQPCEIMVVTFTEKAAKELLTRISNEFVDMNLNINEMYIGTFHSVCLRLMKEHAEAVEKNDRSRMLDAFEQPYLVCRNIDYFNRLGGYSKHITAKSPWIQALEICRYVNQLMEELVDVDSIIEIGAIRVVNGKIVESAEFTFQELCKPYKRSLSQDIQQLTGITPADVKDAREMWEVFSDFMKFVGDDVLLGFNCIAFDSQFLVRAGRYANIIITNRFFDVMRYADQFKEQLGIDARKPSLDAVASALNIENPRAHRALADAITTANVYLKLKAMDTNQAPATLDDLLSDLDDW